MYRDRLSLFLRAIFCRDGGYRILIRNREVGLLELDR
jgi:hypothetical protein